MCEKRDITITVTPTTMQVHARMCLCDALFTNQNNHTGFPRNLLLNFYKMNLLFNWGKEILF